MWERARLGECGRLFSEEEPESAIHTDATELGWRGRGGPDEGAGRPGVKSDAGLWSVEDKWSTSR